MVLGRALDVNPLRAVGVGGIQQERVVDRALHLDPDPRRAARVVQLNTVSVRARQLDPACVEPDVVSVDRAVVRSDARHALGI